MINITKKKRNEENSVKAFKGAENRGEEATI